ncbi:MAG: carbon storage regulator [Thermoguttaceae bacterium]
MLVLSRGRESENRIGSDITIRVLAIHGRHVTLGIEAPGGVRIRRKEIAPVSQDGLRTVVHPLFRSQ